MSGSPTVVNNEFELSFHLSDFWVLGLTGRASHRIATNPFLVHDSFEDMQVEPFSSNARLLPSLKSNPFVIKKCSNPIDFSLICRNDLHFLILVLSGNKLEIYKL